MFSKNNAVLQGTIELLVLKRLSRGPMHGYGIASWIETATDDVLRVEEGSLYPALYRLVQKRWIKGEWGVSDNNRQARAGPVRKFLTASSHEDGGDGRSFGDFRFAQTARRFAEAIPDAELVVIPGCGHISNLECPERFNAAVREFCRGHARLTCAV